VEAIYIPDMMGNPPEADNQVFVESSFQWVHNLVLAVDNYTLQVDILVAYMQGRMDRVNVLAEKEAHPRDMMPESQKHVRDRMFEDQHEFLEQH